MIVYSKPNCPNCGIVKAHCALRGISVTEICLDTPEKVADFKLTHPSARSVPFVILDDGTVIGGFAKFKEYLRTL